MLFVANFWLTWVTSESCDWMSWVCKMSWVVACCDTIKNMLPSTQLSDVFCCLFLMLVVMQQRSMLTWHYIQHVGNMSRNVACHCRCCRPACYSDTQQYQLRKLINSRIFFLVVLYYTLHASISDDNVKHCMSETLWHLVNITTYHYHFYNISIWVAHHLLFLKTEVSTTIILYIPHGTQKALMLMANFNTYVLGFIAYIIPLRECQTCKHNNIAKSNES